MAMKVSGLWVTEAVLRLFGEKAQFKIDREEDGAVLTVKGWDATIHISMSHGQYYCLEAAIDDAKDESEHSGPRMVSGAWFSHDE
jgi:hypothetical protein